MKIIYALILLCFTLFLVACGDEDSIGDIEDYLIDQDSDQAIHVVDYIEELFAGSDELMFPNILVGDEEVRNFNLSKRWSNVRENMVELDYNFLLTSVGAVSIKSYDIEDVEDELEEYENLVALNTADGDFFYEENERQQIIIGDNGVLGVEISSTDENVSKDVLVSILESLESIEDGGVNLYPIPKELDFTQITFPSLNSETINLRTMDFKSSEEGEELQLYYSFSGVSGAFNYIVSKGAVDKEEKEELTLEDGETIYFHDTSYFNHYEWEKGDYHYTIYVSKRHNIKHDDIGAIIQSSLNNSPVSSLPDRLTRD
ncbi:hypothetical protein [Evansella cellulosilytica]|uniref:hypothetical protein n=1 Tax=Evansella cellulosilytica TaxID=1413 RepID=UPI0012F6CD75|nr:hypothetical protein [Evansella cellulosilytica]